MKKLIGLHSLVAILVVAIFCFCSCDLLALSDADVNDDLSDGSTVTQPSENPETPPDDLPDEPAPVIPSAPEPDYTPAPDNNPSAPQPPEIIIYTVTFIEGDSILDIIEIEENSTLDPRPVPDKTGYIFAGWDNDGIIFDLATPVTSDLTLRLLREPITYSVTFIADGLTIALNYYTVENAFTEQPEVPQKEHYTGTWESYSLNLQNITVNAIYAPINYTVTFIADGQTISSVTYNVENISVAEPEVPAKEHYTGAWDSYSLNLENVTVNAVYTPVEYTVTFIADGIAIHTAVYTAENPDIVEPEVPNKAGYTGAWENYYLAGNVVVNAVYTLVTGTDGLIYSLVDGGYSVAGYDGESRDVVIPYYHDGLPVVEISDRAFFNASDTLLSVILPQSLKTIGKNAFNYCGIEEIIIPDGVISIGQRAFASCSKLKKVVISDTVTNIDGFAFYGCTSLESVHIGASVTNIAAYAFTAQSLAEVTFADPDNWTVDDVGGQTPVSAQILALPEAAAEFVKNHITCAFNKLI